MSNPILDQVGVGGTDYDIQDRRGEQLALVDGYYEEMTVGDAEQLVATVGVNDKVPYLFRTSGGSADIGDREVDKLVGGSFPWNQLNTGMELITEVDGITATVTAGKMSISGTCNVAPTYSQFVLTSRTTVFKRDGRKYLIIPTAKAGLTGCLFGIAGYSAVQNSDKGFIFTRTEGTDWTNGVYLLMRQNDVFDVTDLQINIFDLTQLFGSAIADYIYTLETGTPGAGVAWFRKYFPKLFYQYNAGSMESVCANLHKMTGFNQWDEIAEEGGISTSTGENIASAGNSRTKNFIPVVPGTSYYFNSPVTLGLRMYDADKKIIKDFPMTYDRSDRTYTMPENCHFLRFVIVGVTSYQNNICVSIHWDGERDGEYEPYVAHEYPLSPVVLRGIPKLDSGNKLYFDGDTYEADGTVTRRFAEVDLGDLTWQWNSQYKFWHATISAKKAGTTNLISTKYPTGVISWTGNDPTTDIIGGNNSNGTIYIQTTTSYVDATAFTAAVDGVKCVYELDTPTTEQADPFQSPQIVDDWGTEEYVDALATAESNPRDVAIPVGHDTTYRNNLRAKLEMAPESPSGDGDYILRQTSGQNEYVLLEKELPSLPSEDGTYTLKCTVSGSSKTLTWEADAE